MVDADRRDDAVGALRRRLSAERHAHIVRRVAYHISGHHNTLALLELRRLAHLAILDRGCPTRLYVATVSRRRLRVQRFSFFVVGVDDGLVARR